MASATQDRPAVLLLAAVIVLASPVAMRGAAAAGGASSNDATTRCGAEKFPARRSYANCSALPHLGATLYWTYDAEDATLSVAFVAKPPGAGGAGWVSWAINPTGDGMKGAQALVALKASGPASPYVVRTYNVTGYRQLAANSTPVAFKATDLAADESGDGKVRLYGKLQLDPGMKVVNHIWQVGSAVTYGSPAKHAFAKENLDAKGRLALVGGTAPPAPAPAPPPSPASGSSSSAKAGGGALAPSGGKSAATAATYVSVSVLAVPTLVGFLATV